MKPDDVPAEPAEPVEPVEPAPPTQAPVTPEEDIAVVTAAPAPPPVVEVAPEPAEPEPEPDPEPRRVLHKGDEGADVLAAQEQLGAFGNGVFDQRFLDFWRNYQRARGVDPVDELDLDNLPADPAKEPMYEGA